MRRSEQADRSVTETLNIILGASFSACVGMLCLAYFEYGCSHRINVISSDPFLKPSRLKTSIFTAAQVVDVKASRTLPKSFLTSSFAKDGLMEV